MSIRLLKTCQTCTDKNVILCGVNIAIPSEGTLRGQECHSTRRKNDRERPILPKKGRQKTRPLHYMLKKKKKKKGGEKKDREDQWAPTIRGLFCRREGGNCIDPVCNMSVPCCGQS